MKKLVSLFLSIVLVFGLTVPAMAAGGVQWTDNRTSTQVKYSASTAAGGATESFVITVPATLSPNSTGTVTATGNWAANRKLTVTAEDRVKLTSTTGGEVSLTVSLETMEISGNDNAAINVSKTVTVGNWNSVNTGFTQPLFGDWTGRFNYTATLTGGATEPETVNIANITEWIAFADAFNNEEYAQNVNVALTGDIDFDNLDDETREQYLEEQLAGVGTSTYPFTGSVSCGDYEMKNFSDIYADSIFGYVGDEADINLVLRDSSITLIDNVLSGAEVSLYINLHKYHTGKYNNIIHVNNGTVLLLGRADYNSVLSKKSGTGAEEWLMQSGTGTVNSAGFFNNSCVNEGTDPSLDE